MGTVGAWVNPSVAWISSERTSKHGLRAYARGKRRPWKRARTPNSIFLDLPIQVWHLSFTSFFPLLPLFPFSGHIAPDADGLIGSVWLTDSEIDSLMDDRDTYFTS